MPAEKGPRLSVIVPCYQVEPYVGECLDSILAYRGDDIEVIAVDDASPDGTLALLEKYAGTDERLQVVPLDTNGGPGQARNAGLERAVGGYVWFVDADDWLPAGAVEAVLDRLAVSRPDVLIVDHVEVHGQTRVVRSAAGAVTKQRARLLRLAQSPCTKIVRRALLDEIDLRFPSGWYEDVPYNHTLLIGARRVDLLHEVGYCYRQRREGSITSSPSARHFEIFDQYARLFARVDELTEAGHPEADGYRRELFRAMVDHHLVIVGHRHRLPKAARRAFFRKMVEAYRRYEPAGGYPVPTGVQGVKHRLVRRDAYPAFAALRLGYRVVPRAARRGR